ncbi:MAG: site-specific DNA-methyltransferase [Opitutae bacterium]|nr:site-specific DNA-methyltransferase [Opitutae bacterium]
MLTALHNPVSPVTSLFDELRHFSEFGSPTRVTNNTVPEAGRIPVFVNEFWTSKQRAAHPLHEVSYRACFKPQLPRFFIERLTRPGELVYDPFMGRGTTLIEGALLGRRVAGCDVNPLSRVFVEPRLIPPTVQEVADRLDSIDFSWSRAVREDLHVFYHRSTLQQLTALRHYLLGRIRSGKMDRVDQWIQMVATNRLSGHSPGFFSVYTLPPNQAVSLESQKRINAKRRQKPEKRDVPTLILKKSRQLLHEGGTRPQDGFASPTQIFTQSCDTTPQLADDSVDLVVTSPPFLDTVDYAQDNWLRSWFCGIDPATVSIWHLCSLADWTTTMTGVFGELHRVLKPGGFVAFEVGEVRNGKVQLEHYAMQAGIASGLTPVLVLINSQHFTKTANCWGVMNHSKGTNTNRVVLFQKN